MNKRGQRCQNEIKKSADEPIDLYKYFEKKVRKYDIFFDTDYVDHANHSSPYSEYSCVIESGEHRQYELSMSISTSSIKSLKQNDVETVVSMDTYTSTRIRMNQLVKILFYEVGYHFMHDMPLTIGGHIVEDYHMLANAACVYNDLISSAADSESVLTMSMKFMEIVESVCEYNAAVQDPNFNIKRFGRASNFSCKRFKYPQMIKKFRLYYANFDNYDEIIGLLNSGIDAGVLADLTVMFPSGLQDLFRY